MWLFVQLSPNWGCLFALFSCNYNCRSQSLPIAVVNCAPITQSSQLFYNHDSHLIEILMENHLNPKSHDANGSHSTGSIIRHIRQEANQSEHHSISGGGHQPSLRVAIALYIAAASSNRPSLAQSAACNEHHHLDLNSYLAATTPPTMILCFICFICFMAPSCGTFVCLFVCLFAVYMGSH